MATDIRSRSCRREASGQGPRPELSARPLPHLRNYDELGLPAPFRKAIDGELSRDETLAWLGRPSRQPKARPAERASTLAGAALLAGASLLLVGGVSLLFPVVLGLLGISLLFVPKLFARATVSPACYVVTNRRAILFEEGLLGLDPRALAFMKSYKGVRSKSYLPHELLGMERRNGDLIFDYASTFGRASGATGTACRTQSPRGFSSIEQATEVEDLIRTTLLADLQGAGAPAPVTRAARDGDDPDDKATCACGAEIPPTADPSARSVACLACGATLIVPSRIAAGATSVARAH